MSKKHVATCASLGWWAGNRIGTRYFYKFEEAEAAQSQPHFRWRNDSVWREYLAWQAAQSGGSGRSLADANPKGSHP